MALRLSSEWSFLRADLRVRLDSKRYLQAEEARKDMALLSEFSLLVPLYGPLSLSGSYRYTHNFSEVSDFVFGQHMGKLGFEVML